MEEIRDIERKEESEEKEKKRKRKGVLCRKEGGPWACT
jgi:hypothetical protein